MKVGIKIGPKNWKKVLLKSQAKYCEVWFRLDWQQKYISLFKYLKKNKISFGLHFWAMIKGKYLPSMLDEDKEIAQETYKSVRQTIDIAEKWQVKYVNFHPDSYRSTLLDLENSKYKTLNPNKPIAKKKSFNQLLFYLKKIKDYATKKGIISFIETVPKNSPSDFKNLEKGRLKIQKSEGLETKKFFKLTKLGYPICLDIGHTLAQYITEDREKLFKYLLKAAKKMLATIGLIHVTTNLPPFNGADSHNGILEEDFKRGVIPNKLQLIKLLALFKNKDVWLIPEPPVGKMTDNYFALQDIVQKVIE